MTEDPYLERYLQLRKVALTKGFDLRYGRRRANIVDVLLGDVDCKEGALTGEERLQVVNASDCVTVWASSFADAATVFQELTDYLETPDSDDPGIARAACARKESQEMVEQIVAWVTELVGAEE